GSRKSSTPRKRSDRTVSGGAYGRPYFAAMTPVLQSSTNSHGTEASHGLRLEETAEKEKVLTVARMMFRSETPRGRSCSCAVAAICRQAAHPHCGASAKNLLGMQRGNAEDMQARKLFRDAGETITMK